MRAGRSLHPLLARRRYLPLVSDMRFVLAIPEVASHLTCTERLVTLWVDLLRSLQGVDRQRRQLGQHVEIENGAMADHSPAWPTHAPRAAWPPLTRRVRTRPPRLQTIGCTFST